MFWWLRALSSRFRGRARGWLFRFLYTPVSILFALTSFCLTWNHNGDIYLHAWILTPYCSISCNSLGTARSFFQLLIKLSHPDSIRCDWAHWGHRVSRCGCCVGRGCRGVAIPFWFKLDSHYLNLFKKKPWHLAPVSSGSAKTPVYSIPSQHAFSCNSHIYGQNSCD